MWQRAGRLKELKDNFNEEIKNNNNNKWITLTERLFMTDFLGQELRVDEVTYLQHTLWCQTGFHKKKFFFFLIFSPQTSLAHYFQGES